MTKYIGPKTDGENVATQADKLSLSSETPDALTPDQAGAAGTATTAARSDHQHEILAGAAGTITPDATSAEGSSSSFARADHTHAIVAAAAGTIQPDDAAAEGSSSSFARADHTHAITAAAPSANLTASTTNTEGTASSFARSDHSHAITVGAAGTITGTNAEGSSASLARADHNHAIATAAAGTILPDAVSAAGTAASFSRSDHTHAIDAASAGTITGTNAEGTSTSFARADHDHAIGVGVVGTTQLQAAVGNFGAWTDYSPTLKQSGTVAHTKNFASYVQFGKTVIVTFRLTVGNPPGSTGNNAVSVSVPVAAKTKSLVRCGSGSVFDDSTSITYGGVWIQAFSDDTVVNLIGDWSGTGAWGTVPNIALASGDSVQGFLIYEAA